MKRLVIFILILASTVGLVPARLFADQVTDLQAQISNIQAQQQSLFEERAKLQTAIDEAERQGKNLSTTIHTLEASKKKIDNDLRITQASINAANLTIQKLDLTIAEEQKKVTDHQLAVSESMRKLSDYDRNPLLLNMLAERNLGSVWQDQASLSSLEETLTNEIAALNAAQVELSKQKSDKEATKTQLTDLQDQLSGQKQTVQETQAAKAKLLSDTKNQEAAYQKLLTDNLAREKQFEAVLFQFESQLQVALNPSSFPAAQHGILNWPLDKIKVTQQFGKTTDSGRLYASGTHNGTDFGTPVGSPVHAVLSGTIQAMGNTDDQRGCYSYGRWILIKHDNGLTSIYGHLSASIVTTGERVNTGDIIGYSGGAPGAYGSGYSTGPHLHLGLYASQAVQVEQYSTSINCKNVAIPIAPPDGYLDPLAYMPALY